MADIKNEAEPDFESRLKNFFGKRIEQIGSRRRAFLVAPRFDLQTVETVEYLNERFHEPVLGLLGAVKSEDGFEVPLQEYSPPLVRTRDLQERDFAMTPGGNLVCVLAAGDAAPVLWRIGKLADDRRSIKHRPQRKREARMTIYAETRPQLQWMTSPPSAVDLALHGIRWCRTKPKRGDDSAVTLGVVKYANEGEWLVLVRFKAGRLHGVVTRKRGAFGQRWRRSDGEQVNWPQIEHMARRL